MLTCETAPRFQSATPESEPESTQLPERPPWMAAESLDRLPPPLREAVERTVAPAHRHFVLDAGDEMEESLGVTMVHLMWLELLSQIDLARKHAEIASEPVLSDEFRDLIDRHMRLVAAKLRISSFLLRSQRAREAGASGSGPMGGLLGMMAMHQALAERQAACAGTADRQTNAEQLAPSDPSQEEPAEEAGAAEQAVETADATDPGQTESSGPSADGSVEAGPTGQTVPAGGPAHATSGQNSKNAEQHSSGRRPAPLPKPIRRGNLFRR